jgi:hypothetical protein
MKTFTRACCVVFAMMILLCSGAMADKPKRRSIKHAFILATHGAWLATVLSFYGCVNHPPNSTVTINIVTMGTNALAGVTALNRVLLVTASAPSSQVNAAVASIGTNSTPSYINLNLLS